MALDEWPWRSKALCRRFRIGQTTSARILHDKLGLKKFHLCWVPRALSVNEKSKRVSNSKFFLTVPMELRPIDFKPIIIDDDS
jgi:hypothetical protein